MPGIGPMTPALEAFAAFFNLDSDLVQVAAERGDAALPSAASPDAVRKIMSKIADREKTDMLMRLHDGDPHVASELRAEVRKRLGSETRAPSVALLTVGELRARAEAIRLAREHEAAVKEEAARKRQAREAEKARRARVDALARRGDAAWAEVEAEIKRRNPAGYDKAASLLADLRTLADERGTSADFTRRLQAIRERHAGKARFLERLPAIG
jgi:hypothetical protein